MKHVLPFYVSVPSEVNSRSRGSNDLEALSRDQDREDGGSNFSARVTRTAS